MVGDTTTSVRKRIRVLVVDDSAVVRNMVTQTLLADPAVEVAGSGPTAQSLSPK